MDFQESVTCGKEPLRAMFEFDIVFDMQWSNRRFGKNGLDIVESKDARYFFNDIFLNRNIFGASEWGNTDAQRSIR